MELQARINAIFSAPKEVLDRIDDILEGRDVRDEPVHTKLVTIAEGCRFLGWSYSKMRRAIGDGLVDVVRSTEVLARRAARNAARREEYRQRKLQRS